jgi:hypothetical protein
MDKRGIALVVGLALAATACAGPGAPQRRCRFNLKTIDGAIEMYLLDKNRTREEIAKDPTWREQLKKGLYLQDLPRCFRASWHYGSEYYRGGAGMIERALPQHYEVLIPLSAPQEYRLKPTGEPYCTAHGTSEENQATEIALRPPVLDVLERLPFLGVALVVLLGLTFSALHAIVNRKQKS